MHWNHRVLAKRVTSKKVNKKTGKLVDTTIIEYGLYEVYYDDHNKPDSCTQESMKPLSYWEDDVDCISVLKQKLDWMRQARQKHVLAIDNFPSEFKNVKLERAKYMKKISGNSRNSKHR